MLLWVVRGETFHGEVVEDFSGRSALEAVVHQGQASGLRSGKPSLQPLAGREPPESRRAGSTTAVGPSQPHRTVASFASFSPDAMETLTPRNRRCSPAYRRLFSTFGFRCR